METIKNRIVFFSCTIPTLVWLAFIAGLADWGGEEEDSVLNQVLAASQAEYYNSLKRQAQANQDEDDKVSLKWLVINCIRLVPQK